MFEHVYRIKKYTFIIFFREYSRDNNSMTIKYNSFVQVRGQVS